MAAYVDKFGSDATTLLNPLDAARMTSVNEPAPSSTPEPTPDITAAHPGQPGAPIEFSFLRNPVSSQQYATNQDFAQNVEPAGRYMSEHAPGSPVPDGWETGTVSFARPLHIAWGPESASYTDPANWKQRLTTHYKGKTGLALSKALRADGYDAIITTSKYGTEEVIDLTSIPEPERVFHGTTHDFTDFDFTKIGANGVTEGSGIYFTNDPAVYRHYAGDGTGYVHEVAFTGSKPLSADQLTLTRDERQTLALAVHERTEFLSNWDDTSTPEGLASALDMYLDDTDSQENDIDVLSDLIIQSGGSNPAVMEPLCEKLGYDHAITHDAWGTKGHSVYVAFVPQAFHAIATHRGTVP